MPIPLRVGFDAQMARSAAMRSKEGPQAPLSAIGSGFPEL